MVGDISAVYNIKMHRSQNVIHHRRPYMQVNSEIGQQPHNEERVHFFRDNLFDLWLHASDEIR